MDVKRQADRCRIFVYSSTFKKTPDTFEREDAGYISRFEMYRHFFNVFVKTCNKLGAVRNIPGNIFFCERQCNNRCKARGHLKTVTCAAFMSKIFDIG